MNKDNVDELVNDNSEDSVLRDERENKRQIAAALADAEGSQRNKTPKRIN